MNEKIDISYEGIWKAIIRPPRDEYSEDLDLGQEEFYMFCKKYIRRDYEIIVTRGNCIKCSLIQPDEGSRVSIEMPLVIYLHGNSSSRAEGIKHVSILLRKGINLFTFDFAGCGKSEGEYISLGYHEKNDLKIVVDFVSKIPGVSKIGLWGRSMGAATALIYGHRDKRINAICLDSPFSKFIKLAKEICTRQKALPNIIMDTVISFLRNTILKKNDFDIYNLNPIDDAALTQIPSFFIHAMKDDLIKLEHTIELFEACPQNCDKTLTVCEGNHNTPRQKHVLEQISNFFESHLCVDKSKLGSKQGESKIIEGE